MENKSKKKKLVIISGLLAGCYVLYKGFLSKESPEYSMRWIENLTDSQWEYEREIVRQKFCNPEYNDSLRIKFQNILDLFDKVKSKRDWASKKLNGPAIHREHGWYLPNDD